MGLSLQGKICAWCFSALRQSSGARFDEIVCGEIAYGDSACSDSAYGDRPVYGEIACGNRLYQNILLYPLYCVQHVFVTPFVTCYTICYTAHDENCHGQGAPLSTYSIVRARSFVNVPLCQSTLLSLSSVYESPIVYESPCFCGHSCIS